MARGKWLQKRYDVVNKSKYIGVISDKLPFYRSSWEKRFMYYCDMNTNVIRWASESIVIPYFYEVDQKVHKYVTDFYVEMRTRDGSIKKYVIEVKPSDQVPGMASTKPPKRKTAKALANYKNRMETLRKNQSKWDFARKYCQKKGYEFKVITEKDMFL